MGLSLDYWGAGQVTLRTIELMTLTTATMYQSSDFTLSAKTPLTGAMAGILHIRYLHYDS